MAPIAISSFRPRAAAQLWVLVLLTGITWWASQRGDVFERFAAWTARHEGLQVDELLVVGTTLSFYLFGVCVYRWGRLARYAGSLQHTADAIAQAQADLHEVLRASPVVIFLLRESAGHLAPQWISANLETLFGYSAEEVTSREWWLERVHPDDRADALRVSESILRDGSAIHEFRFRKPDGEYRWILEDLRGFGGTAGLEVVGSWTDITDRKVAEGALHRSERDYHNLFDHANDAILLLDPENETVVAANPRACSLYGLSPEEFIGMSLRAISRDPAAGDAHMRRMSAGALPYRFDTLQTRADGSELHVEVTASLTEYHGRPAVLSINRDVNERVRAERALRESEARFRMLYDYTPSLFFTVGEDGTLLSVNRHGAGYLGYEPQDLCGRNLRELCPPGVRENTAGFLRTALERPDETHEREWPLARRDGDVIWVREIGRAFPQPDGGSAVLLVSEDITATKVAEEELRAARSSAERTAARMRAVAESAVGVVCAGSAEGLLEIICHATRRVIDFDAFMFGVYDEEQNSLSYLGHYDQATYGSPRAVQVGGTPAERVIQERRSLLTLSSADAAARGAHLTGTMRRSESIIRTPILAGDRVVGMISVQSYTPAHYDGADVEVLEAMAAVAAPVLLSLNLHERVQASEEALAESELRFRAVVDSLSEGLVITDLNGIVRYANPRVAGIFDLSPGSLVGETLSPDLLEPPAERVGETAGWKPGAATGYRMRHTRRDGSAKWLEVTVAPLRSGSGAAVGLVHAVTDVTERLESDEALRASESQFRAIFDNAAIGMAVVDRSGRLTRSNTAFREMLGYTEAELNDMEFTDLRHEGDAAAGLGSFHELLRGDRDFYRVDTRYRRRGGEVIWGALTVSVIRDEAGKAVQAVKMVENITDRRRAEQAAHDQRAYLRTVIDADPNLIYARDELGRFTLMNRAAAALFGATPDQMVGRSVADLAGAERGLANLDRLDEKVLQTGNSIFLPEESATLTLTGGVRWYQVRKVRLVPPGGRLSQVLCIAADITERKRAEAALRQSEARLRAIFSNAGLGVLLTSLDGRVIEANPAAESMLAYSRERLLQLDFLDFTHPEDLDLSAATYRKTLAGERDSSTGERRLVRGDGETIWASITTTLVRSPSGEPLYVVDIVQDVTDRHRANRERAEIAERYRMLADGTDDVVSLHDAAGNFLFVSPSVAKASGRAPEDLAGTPAIDTVHPDDRARVLAANHRAARTGAAEVEWRLGSACHTPTWFASRISVRRGADGLVHRIICSSRDVSARKRAEAAVRFQAGLLDVVGQGVIATDLDGTVLFWNGFAELLLGWPAAEAMGRRIWALAPATSPVSEREERWCKVKSGETWSGELEIRGRYGAPFPAMVIMNPIRDGEGGVTGVVAVCSDLREQKALERQFQQAQKMEAVGRLAGGVAHDFNNMLTAIRGNAQLVLMDLPGDSALREDVREIDRAAGRAADLTRQLLAFSRSQVLQPKLLDLNSSVRGVESMLRRLVREDVKLATVLDEPLGTVRADPAQVEQILLNLVVNARDAMPSGGNVSIETFNVDVDGAEAAARKYAGPGSYVGLTVSDTGTGMDRDTLERVFEPFFTTKALGVGTGLGLSTVYGIVNQSGGYIWADSEPGHGARFTVWFPRVEGVPDAAEAENDVVSGAGSETVLLVEDEEAVGALAEKVLSRNGYRVLRASHPADALRLFQSHADLISLLITDMVMPETSGRELAEQLLAVRPELPVLYMSGYMDTALMSTDALGPGTEFLPKPFTGEILTRRVRQVLDGAFPPSR